jgi:hypothetical protein
VKRKQKERKKERKKEIKKERKGRESKENIQIKKWEERKTREN